MVSTGTLPAGTYYVSAAALLAVVSGDGFGECYIATGSAPGTRINNGVVGEGTATVAETAAVTVTAGDTLVEVCETNGTNGSVAQDAGIIAIRVLSSSHQ